MTATVARTAWWDANGDLIRFASTTEGGRHHPAADAAIANLVGGPGDGRAAVRIRGRVPRIVGKRVKRADLIAWYRLDPAPSKLTYRFMYVSPYWPGFASALTTEVSNA